MSWEISRGTSFEAAHQLPHVPEGHKCGRMHGHSYTVVVTLASVRLTDGWVCDFADIDAQLDAVRRTLDHRVLNEVPGLENPTSEVIARWIWDRLSFPELAAVEVRESPRSRCVYRGRK